MTSRETSCIIPGLKGRGVTRDLGSYSLKTCQFSNEMSQSQKACHKDVTYDTPLRLLRGFEGQIAVFSDLARPAHIWSDGALGVRVRLGIRPFKCLVDVSSGRKLSR